MKKEIWKHLYKLIAAHRGRFLLAVCLALLSTAANLVEPLVYREAVNDIAGLFVKEANDRARLSSGLQPEEGEGPVETFFREKIARKALDLEQGLERKVQREYVPPPAPVPASPGRAHVKKPHSTTHVAERTVGETARTLLWVVLVIFLVNVLGYVFWLLAENLNVRLNCEIEQRFIQGAFAHALKLPLDFFGKRAPSVIAKRIDQSEEVSEILDAFSQHLLPEVLSLAGILTIMFLQNTRLTLIAVAVIPFYLFIAWRSSQKLESGLNAYYERWEEVSGKITGALAGIKTVKLSGAEHREVQAYKELSDAAYKNYIDRSILSHTYTFWQGLLTNLATALVLGYGGYLALIHKLTPGDVVMFVAYLDKLYSPIDELTSLWVNLQQHFASIARAFRLLDNNKEEKRGKPFVLGGGAVEMRDVHFSYAGGREVLRGVSFVFPPGRITGIVGASGAGKTTAVDLLLKLYEYGTGSILLDGQELRGLDASGVRAQIGMVAADGAVFSMSLAENIRYKNPAATDAEVREAAGKAGLSGLIARLPEGLGTTIGQDGMGLSVGERQRLQIARVLVSRPKVLVLDEATANLDYNTEAELKKAIFGLRTDSTIIIVAHRYSMVRDADYVYVMSEGKVIEQGAPQALAGQGGWFAGFAAAAETTAGDAGAAPDEAEDEGGEEDEEEP